MKSSSLKVIDLFSGCGGLSLGFQNSGFEIVAAFENWKSAINRERSYLQTFPDNFIFAGSKTDLEQMIGNAVPVKLAEYVAKCLLMYIQDQNKYHISNVMISLTV